MRIELIRPAKQQKNSPFGWNKWSIRAISRMSIFPWSFTPVEIFETSLFVVTSKTLIIRANSLWFGLRLVRSFSKGGEMNQTNYDCTIVIKSHVFYMIFCAAVTSLPIRFFLRPGRSELLKKNVGNSLLFLIMMVNLLLWIIIMNIIIFIIPNASSGERNESKVEVTTCTCIFSIHCRVQFGEVCAIPHSIYRANFGHPVLANALTFVVCAGGMRSFITQSKFTRMVTQHVSIILHAFPHPIFIHIRLFTIFLSTQIKDRNVLLGHF